MKPKSTMYQTPTFRSTSCIALMLLCGTLAACKGDPTVPPVDDPPPASTLRQVEIEPPVLTIEPNAQIQLVAMVKDADGNPVDADVTWSVSPDWVATVSEAGVVTGLDIGSATVSATTDGGLGRMRVTVETTASRVGVGLNEPDGFIPVADRGFVAVEEGGWIRKISTHFQITEDSDAPISGPAVGEAVFDAGWQGGEAPVATDRWIRDHNFRSVYLSFTVKLSENWQGGANGGNIFGYVWLNDNPGVLPTYVGAMDQPLIPQVRLHGTPMPPDGAVNLEPNLEVPVIERGKWHRWEVLLVMNDDAKFNGQVHWWIDGVKAGEYTDIAFSHEQGTRVWQYVTWRPIWSTLGDTVQETMWMRLDHYYVSGRRR